MANEDHVRRAGYAVGVWNRWRDEHPDIAPDLSGANLSASLYRKGKLFGANLSGTDFRRSNMREADLHGSVLSGADLSKTDLRGANLAEADLSGAELCKANLVGADLTGAKLAGAKLRKTDLENTIGLTQEQIDEASGDTTTKLPRGLKRPPGWTGA